MFGFSSWAEFPDKGFFGVDVAEEFFEIEFTGEGDSVITIGPVDVMDMATDEVGSHFAEPLIVIEQAEVVFELDVTKVVPVSDPWVVFEVLLKSNHF